MNDSVGLNDIRDAQPRDVTFEKLDDIEFADIFGSTRKDIRQLVGLIRLHIN